MRLFQITDATEECRRSYEFGVDYKRAKCLECDSSRLSHVCLIGLHLTMHRTVGLTGFIGPITLNLTLVH